MGGIPVAQGLWIQLGIELDIRKQVSGVWRATKSVQ